MSLLRTMVDGYAQLRAEVSGAPAPWDDFWYGPVGAPSSTGMRVTPDTAKKLAAAISCVNKIAKTIAMLPCRVYKIGSDGSNKVADWHPLYDLLYSEPNDQQTSFEFRQMMQGHVELRGNAYAEILPGPRGPVDQLIPLHPDRVKPLVMKDTGRIVYRYEDPVLQQTRFLNQENVFHLKNWSEDGVTGQSTISMGVDVFGLALAAQDYYARFLKNDATPPIAITGASFKTKQDKDAFRQDWQTNQSGANRHKVAVLSPGMDVKAIGVAGKDVELLDARKFSRIEIASLFDVPPHLIGETEKTATYASVEQFNIMFLTFCILPRCVMWEQTIQRSLILSNKYKAEFSAEALLRGDNATRAQYYQTMIQNGVFCQDDARKKENMNPIPNGEGAYFWRPLNWARLGDVHTSIKGGNGAADPGGDSAETGAEDGSSPTTAKIDPRFIGLAGAAAERCVRKEIAAVQKLSAKNADVTEYSEFYKAHAAFISQVLKVPEADATAYCDARYRQFLNGTLDTSEKATQLMTTLAVGGKLQ